MQGCVAKEKQKVCEFVDSCGRGGRDDSLEKSFLVAKDSEDETLSCTMQCSLFTVPGEESAGVPCLLP